MPFASQLAPAHWSPDDGLGSSAAHRDAPCVSEVPPSVVGLVVLARRLDEYADLLQGRVQVVASAGASARWSSPAASAMRAEVDRAAERLFTDVRAIREAADVLRAHVAAVRARAAVASAITSVANASSVLP